MTAPDASNNAHRGGPEGGSLSDTEELLSRVAEAIAIVWRHRGHDLARSEVHDPRRRP
jgi:hypothetical protein